MRSNNKTNKYKQLFSLNFAAIIRNIFDEAYNHDDPPSPYQRTSPATPSGNSFPLAWRPRNAACAPHPCTFPETEVCNTPPLLDLVHHVTLPQWAVP